MKNKLIISMAALIFTSMSAVHAQNILTAWTFDNVSIGINSSPSPSTGIGTASALGMANSYNNTNSISNPDVQSLSGSSSGGPNCWRIRGGSVTVGYGGNGWSTNAPIGTQGVQFSGSTFGYKQVMVSFDVYATADAEANLQVQYTTAGTNWINAAITSSRTLGDIITNNVSSSSTVSGSYIKLVSGWNTNITVDLTGISGADNNTNFAIRLVNASTGTNCVDTTGAVYDNTSGSWTFDNVVIQGVGIDTIVDWTFENYVSTATIITNPVAAIGGTNAGEAYSIGFNNAYTYAGGNGSLSVDCSDINNTGGSSSGNAGPNAWRVRGGTTINNPGIGWNYQAPIGTQGAEYDVSTVGYTNIIVTFDLYFTSAAEAKMCMLYTTDGWNTTNVAQTLYYAGNPAYDKTNSNPVADPNTVAGTYFYETGGQGFYNYITADFSLIPGVANNPLFGFRIVNAATGPTDCLNSSGTTYNNSSGNCRFDNVVVGGTAGTAPPQINYDPNASVDHPFTNTFTDNPAWRTNIALIYVNGVVLTNSAYTTNTPGMIIYTPSKSTLLQSSGIKNISIIVPGFGTARVTQPLAAGVATQLAITTQPAAPSASGGTLTINPVMAITDQYGNGTTNPYPNVSVTASVSNSVAWTLGGGTHQTAVNGFMVFTDLTATVNGSSPVTNAAITFTLTGYSPLTVTNSSSFNIGPPPVPFTPGDLAVLQFDTSGNNTTFSLLEIKPSAAGQTNAINIIPISATGTNGLRLSSSGTCGKLSLSDDGTLVCFAAFQDNSAATLDETLNLNRAAVGLNYTNLVDIGATYTSTSLGGSQARSCTTVDDFNWIVDDKAGLYEGNSGSGTIAQPNLNPYNNVVVKTFGGVPYVETQKVAAGAPLPVIYTLGEDPDNGDLYDVTFYNAGLTTDANAGDFYVISTNGGTSYDVLYILDQNSATNGAINKFSLVSGTWVANGSFTNGTGGDSLFATTNGIGEVYLYLTTGVSSKNQLVRLTDAAGWNAPINITSSNVIYTASGKTYLKGLTFVPQQIAYTNELIPPPILTAQSYVETNGFSSFTITNTPDDPRWRSNITAITVNGSPLSAAAYTTNSAGKIVFNPAQDALLQSPGVKNILIGAAGYSTNSITQVIVGGPAQLAITTQPKAPAADGGVLTNQPVVVVQDQNGFTVLTATPNIVAQVGAGAWTIGGTTTKAAVSGTATFSGLTAFGTNAVIGATISFTSAGLTGATSSPFNISAPIQSNLGAVTLSGGKLKFSFANATGLSFSVLGTNNIAAPLASWPVIGTAVENPAGSGNYQFTDPNPATNSTVFYILRQP